MDGENNQKVKKPDTAGTPDNATQTQQPDQMTAGAMSNDGPGQTIDPASVVSPPDLMINNQSVQKIDGVDGRLQDGMDDEQQEEREHESQVQQYFQDQQNAEEDQGFGLGEYIEGDTYGAPNQILPKDREDLETIIESISYGKIQQVKKLQFQAFTAAIAHEDQVKFVMDYLNNVNNTTHQRFPTARNRILAYRVSQLDQISQKEVIAEGFDDDGEDGAGEKLLHLLQKMEIENIVVIVCIWNSGVQIGSQQLKGGEFYRIVIERARELLNSIQQEIYQEEISKINPDFQLNADIINKIGDSSLMPGMKGPKIGRHRRNNTHQATTFGVVGTDATVAALGSQMQKDKDGLDDYDRKIFQHFREELTLKDLENSSEEIEMSLRELTRANVMELRAISKPSPMVEKTLQIVCALRGFKNLNWSTARDFLGKTSLKIELKQTSSRTVKSVDVFRSQQILVQKTNTMLTPENVQIHSQGAALLLVWAANVIKNYAATKWLHDELQGTAEEFSNLPGGYRKKDLQQITIESKIKIRQQKRKDTEAFNVKKDEKRKKAKGSDDEDDDDDGDDKEGEEGEDDEMAKRQKEEKLRAKRELRAVRAKQKVGKIGYYMPAKAMQYNLDNDTLMPEKRKGPPKQLFDMSVAKKGKGAVDEYLAYQRHSDFKKEEAFLEAEEDRLTLAAREAERLRKLEEDQKQVEKEKKQEAKKQEMKGAAAGGDKKKEEEVQGRIRLTEAQNLPNNIDDVIKRLNEIDFGVQELDILIELSKTLKNHRQKLFPETSFMFTLGKESGLTQDELEKAEQGEDN